MLDEEPLQPGLQARPIPEAAASGAADVTAAKRPSLWHHPDYVKLWSAATISLMGSQVSQIAIPFIAAVLLLKDVPTESAAFQVALLGTVDMLPFLLFALPAGAWLDRVRRRPMLVLGDFGRAAALVSIPVAYALGVLTMWQLYLVGFIAGTLTVLFDVADQSYLPALIDADDLVEGNSKLQVSASAAQILGPSLAGGLLGVIGKAASPFAIFVDAISFALSGSLIAAIRKHEPRPERPRDAAGNHTHILREIRDGLAYVLGHSNLRMIAGSTATSNLGTSMAFAVFPVFAYVELGLNPGVVGTAFGLGGFGVLAGAFTAGPIGRRFGIGPTIVGSSFVGGLSGFLVVILPPDQLIAGGLLLASGFIMGFSAVVYNVGQVSYRQAITPLTMQGRMNATMRFMVWGTMPLGSLLGGILAAFLPLRITILVGAAVAFTSFLWVLFSPVRSLREIPRQARSDKAEA